MKKLVSIILPTYNEKENIERLIDYILRNVKHPLEIIVVDDDSPDKTWQLVESIGKKKNNVRLLRRINKRGDASAILDGISVSRGDIVIWMDCDFSHPPSRIPKMLSSLNENDVAIASRYVEGGKDARTLTRIITSRLFNLYAQKVLGLPVKDSTTGFVAVKKKVFDKVRLFKEGHGEYCVKFLYDCWKNGFSIEEIPIVSRDRKKGKSKTCEHPYSLLKHGINYGMMVLKVRFSKTFMEVNTRKRKTPVSIPDIEFEKIPMDDFYDRTILGMPSRARVKKILKEVSKSNGTMFLDAGCEAGHISIELARNGFQVTGFDICKPAISKLKQKLKKYRGDKITGPIIADIHNLPLKPKSFDGVVCTEVLAHINNPHIALKELHRVLKPGGRIIITFPNRKTRRFAYAIAKNIGLDTGAVENITLHSYTLNEMKKNCEKYFKFEKAYGVPSFFPLTNFIVFRKIGDKG